MNETTKAILSTVTIVACLALIGVLAYLRVPEAAIAGPAVVGVIIAWLTRTPDRRDPPIAPKLIPFVAAGAVIASMLACGCGSPEAKHVEADSAYDAELANCTKNAKTLDESILCEKKVDAKWHITTKETAK